MTNPRGWNGSNRVWDRAAVELADRLEREGRTWMQIWREHFADRGSNNSLRQAVVAYRKGGWPAQFDRPRSRHVQPAAVEKPMPPSRAQAILSRPNGRQAALLACEPDCARWLMAW